jgi:DoxX-like family
MFTAHVVVTALTAAANTFAATVDFTRPDWLLRNMAKARVPQSWLFSLGALKAAGALGLLIGIGVASAWGRSLSRPRPVLHRRPHHPLSRPLLGHRPPVAFLLLAVGSLVLRLASS